MSTLTNRSWKNPVKGIPAKESTMNVSGDFRKFTNLMKRVVNPPVKPKESSASHGPDAS